MRDDSAKILLPFVLQEVLVGSAGVVKNVHSLMLSIQQFPRRPQRPNLQGAQKNGFGEAVVAYDMPEPYEFLSIDSCQKRLLWTHKGVDLAPHPVVGLCPK